MSVDARASDFFVAGGTLRLDAPSYVKRPEDDELLDLALTGEFCYVLTPRQMGKSSLMVQTARRLQERGVRTAVIDLTSIGTDVSVEQWYLGLITRLKSQLGLRIDSEAWWIAHASLSVVQRFTDFLHDVVLAEIEGPVVIFIDEIDTTLSLGFSDDFFAAIRYTYNARASDPAYNRLTFVLLGVAAPADLIKDPNRTPFNIGHRVDLHEFSREDAQVLQQGLEAVFPEQGKTIFARILYWTNGHPYLTQKLCLAATETGNGRWTDERVDGLVERLFLAKEVRKEANLQFVRSKTLDHPQARQLLALYRKVYRGERIADDERSLIQNQLKLSGLVQAKSGYLSVRNRVYGRTFDLAWVRENTPVNWTLIAASALGIVALLAVGLTIYNLVVSFQFQDCGERFLRAHTSEEKVALLARAFSSRSLLIPTDYDYRAREWFYGLRREEQLDLFDAAHVQDSDLIIIIKGLYTTLADVDGTDSTGPLLEAMAKALDRFDETEEAVRLGEEIDNWREGREFFQQGLYSEARDAYTRAMALNGENPATLYERARVLIELAEYGQALSDLDQAVAIAGRTVAPTSTPSSLSTTAPTASPSIPPTSTPAIPVSVAASPTSFLASTETPTPTATPVPTSITSAFANRGQIVSAVRDLIYGHSDLARSLTNAPGSEYLNLREFGLVPTVTPTPSPTAIGRPMPVQVPTGTPTPVQAPTEEPAESTQAPVTPELPTNTPPATATASPTYSLTPTFTPTRPPPTTTPRSYPPPVLGWGGIIGCNVTFRWGWAGTLAEDEWFEVRIGKDPNPLRAQTWTQEFQYTYVLTESGKYAWQIAICRGKPEDAHCSSLDGTELVASEYGFFEFGGCETKPPHEPTPTPP